MTPPRHERLCASELDGFQSWKPVRVERALGGLGLWAEVVAVGQTAIRLRRSMAIFCLWPLVFSIEPAAAQSGFTFRSVTVAADSELLAGSALSENEAALLLGVRSKFRPTFYDSLELVSLNGSSTRKLDVMAAIGESRAPLRNVAVATDGSMWAILPPRRDATAQRPRLVAIRSDGLTATHELAYDWSPDSVITSISALPGGRVLCGFRSATQAVLLRVDNGVTTGSQIYPKPNGFYKFFPLNAETTLAASGELSNSADLSVLSTLHVLNSKLEETGRADIVGWIRDVAHSGSQSAQLTVLSTARQNDDRSFRVAELSLSEGSLKIVSTRSMEAAAVPGSLSLRPGMVPSGILMVRSDDRELVAKSIKDGLADRPLGRILTEKELLLKVHWLKHENRLLLIHESLIATESGARKRIGVSSVIDADAAVRKQP